MYYVKKCDAVNEYLIVTSLHLNFLKPKAKLMLKCVYTKYMYVTTVQADNHRQLITTPIYKGEGNQDTKLMRFIPVLGHELSSELLINFWKAFTGLAIYIIVTETCNVVVMSLTCMIQT